MAEKRERSVNFSNKECQLLMDIVMKYKHIVENRTIDSVTLAEKNEAWEKITDVFNAINTTNIHRSVKTLKSKYDTSKKQLRKKIADSKKQMHLTEGDPQIQLRLSDFEEKLYSMINTNVEGLEIRSECDHLNMSPMQSLPNIQPNVEDERILENILSQPSDNENTLITIVGVPNVIPAEILIDKEPRTKNYTMKKSQVFFKNKKERKTETDNFSKLTDSMKELVELQLRFTREQHKIKLKILEKELEEKENIIRRNNEIHSLKMRILNCDLQAKLNEQKINT